MYVYFKKSDGNIICESAAHYKMFDPYSDYFIPKNELYGVVCFNTRKQSCTMIFCENCINDMCNYVKVNLNPLLRVFK